MALELDGKPFELSQDQLTQYSKKYVFRVGRQHIRINRNPEMRAIETAPVHIMPQYRHYVIVGKNKTPKGLLVWFETKDYQEERKKYEYTPARISIGYNGYIESYDPELNFFLDNHPSNENVKADSEHPNNDPRTGTYFATYRKEVIRDAQVDLLRLSSELALKILTKAETPQEELLAIAQLTQKGAVDYKISHRLHNLVDMDDQDLRAELARLCRDYPVAMKEIIDSKNLNYVETTNKLIDAQIIKMVNGEWVMMANNKPGQALMKIPTNQDPLLALVDWFKNYDTKQNKFRMLKEKLAEVDMRRKKVSADEK
jgi:hypothetical protein